MLVHAKTRKKQLVDKLCDLGLSISYKRVLEISTSLANSVCKHYDDQNLVCPVSLEKGIFTTSAVDNIDHNPSSTTAQGSLHGTGISIFQHILDNNREQCQQPYQINLEKVSSSKIQALPDYYVNIPTIGALPKEKKLPENFENFTIDSVEYSKAIETQNR